MERTDPNGLVRIGSQEYEPHFQDLQHIFLVGDLKNASPHPFFRDPRVEFIVCEYAVGDHGAYHWHPVTTEYEFVLEGSMVYQDAATGEMQRFRPGDLRMVPPGACVRRFIDEPCRTVAIKVPSGDRKIHCRDCQRSCEERMQAFREIA
jgi:hypothetical protein